MPCTGTICRHRPSVVAKRDQNGPTCRPSQNPVTGLRTIQVVTLIERAIETPRLSQRAATVLAAVKSVLVLILEGHAESSAIPGHLSILNRDVELHDFRDA
jgi:hypothetical protein